MKLDIKNSPPNSPPDVVFTMGPIATKNPENQLLSGFKCLIYRHLGGERGISFNVYLGISEKISDGVLMDNIFEYCSIQAITFRRNTKEQTHD